MYYKNQKLLAFVFLAFFLVSCGGSNPASNTNQNTTVPDASKYAHTIKTQAQIDEYIAVFEQNKVSVNGEFKEFIAIESGFGFFEETFLDDAKSIKGLKASIFLTKSKDIISVGMSFDNPKNLYIEYIVLKNKKDITVDVFRQFGAILLNDKNASTRYKVNISDSDSSLDVQTGKVLINGAFDVSIEGQDTKHITVNFNQYFGLAGSVEVYLHDSDTAIMTGGDLGVETYVKLKKLLDDNPSVKEIVLGNIDGSINDEINVETGRLIRARGLNTKVSKNSAIYSGAVDLFASGVERIYTRGADVGVHSWCCQDGVTADKLPRDHKAHYSQLGYYSVMLPETGYDFYFFTLESSPFTSVYSMKESELLRYKLATKIID